ncbi:chorismate lyase [Pasteurella sp. PK-2025]|uniref:chorismate lyase n=1 Tax=Pasteurella sp. PK-2025 TaxID=3413133 RepID=UPI003C73A38D
MSNYSECLQQAEWVNTTNMPSSQSIGHWLTLSTSLTKQLITHFGEIKVCVLAEYWVDELIENEQQFFPKQENRLWCREVILKHQAQPLIFARTLIPVSLVNQHRELQQLGERPLGEWLFMFPDRIRTKLEWTQDNATGLYARRALMQIGQESMMVAELFLTPQIFTRTIT